MTTFDPLAGLDGVRTYQERVMVRAVRLTRDNAHMIATIARKTITTDTEGTIFLTGPGPTVWAIEGDMIVATPGRMRVSNRTEGDFRAWLHAPRPADHRGGSRMNFYAYRLTGDAEFDTRALRAWGLGVTVSDEGGELAVEVNNPGYWLTGCCGYRFIADAGCLVVFSPDERSPMHIKVAQEITEADAPKNRGDR